MHEKIDPYLELYLKSQNDKIDDAFTRIDKANENNNKTNKEIEVAVQDLKDAVKEIGWRHRIFIAILIVVWGFVQDYVKEIVKDKFSEPERKQYYEKRVSESETIKQLKLEIQKLKKDE